MSSNNNTEQQSIFPQPYSIDFISLLKLLWLKKLIIIGCSIFVAVITAVITLQMPNIYKSTTTLLPVSADTNNNLSQYSGLAAMAGVTLPGQSGTDIEKIMALLKSRTLKERVVKDLELENVLLEKFPQKVSTLYATLEIFSENYTASHDSKTNVISISFEHEDPKLATKIVNYTSKSLSLILEEKSLTITSKKLALTEKQLKNRRDELDSIKSRLLDFQRRTQVLQPETQAQGVMELYTTLVQQKIALEVELETLKNALSDTNPKILVKEQQLVAVINQLNNISNVTSDGKFDTTDVPENIAEYTEITAELELAQSMYLTVYAQWEQLKMQEQEDQLYVEIIDKGRIPEEKIAPRRSIIVILLFVLTASIFILIYSFNPAVRRKSKLRY